jgi:tetratricopeptide (TPR) repeat protein
MKTLRGLLLGVMLAQSVSGAEPPARNLTEKEQQEVQALQQQIDRHLLAREFEEAVKVAQRIVDYRSERQGAGHWQVIDARLALQRWQPLTKVPAAERPQVVQALRGLAMASHFEKQGFHRQAFVESHSALTICKKVFGEDHPSTARAYASLASALTTQKRHAEALANYQKALAICQKALGEEHAETAAAQHNLGLCLANQGKQQEAIVLFRKSLEVRRKALGEQHPDIAGSCDNIAACLLAQGKQEEALPLLEQALKCRGQALGEEHIDTALSYQNLAASLNMLNRQAEALPLFRKAVAVFQKQLGEQHVHTAVCCNNLGLCLKHLQKQSEALPLFQKALAFFQKVEGGENSDAAISYEGVASCLGSQGKHSEALPLHRKAVLIRQKVLGEEHRQTGISYSSLGQCLQSLSRDTEALILFQKALVISRKTEGEEHPDTAVGYYNVAYSLDREGKHQEALALFQKALSIRLKVLGEEHSDTARSLNGVAACLRHQGKHAEALPLFQKALAIRRKVLGEDHRDTASSYNGVAHCLEDQTRHTEALPLFQKVLAIRQKTLGEEHAETAASYENLAYCLGKLGKHTEAQELFGKSLSIRLKVLGEQHPDTASSYNNLAFFLYERGKYSEALPLFEKALAIQVRSNGELGPDCSLIHNNIASCLTNQGKHAEAARHLEAAILGRDVGRLHAGASGFDRSLFLSSFVTPRTALAACLGRLGQPEQAWEHAEADLAFGLLEDWLPSINKIDGEKEARRKEIDHVLLPLVTRTRLSDEDTKRRDALIKERNELQKEQSRAAAQRARARILSRDDIQKQIAPDMALVFWMDVFDQHLGCVLRGQGAPAWVRLPGSGKENSWTEDDQFLPSRALAAVIDPRTPASIREPLLAQLHRQRIAPLAPHLKGMKHLLVVPSGALARLPLEAWVEPYTISYVPSASLFARWMQQHRQLQAASLLVLADPVFTRAAVVLPPAPAHGLLISAITPGSLAARIGLQSGDILQEYDGKKLATADDLKPPTGEERVQLKFWREGKVFAGRIPAGKLGVAVDRRPVAEALAAWRAQEANRLALTRSGKQWSPLPGTRLEARTLAALQPTATLLLGSDASVQKLDELAATGKLTLFRLVHLATHGEANEENPDQTALILAQDQLPEASDNTLKALLSGKQPLDGRLTVRKILQKWQLDADLVVLSACQTGLGKFTQGEGMLGFTQALLQKGARSVVLSRWKVDDAATALLMERFYRNLLGKRDGLKEGMKRAEALQEAKTWLRNLSRAEAEKHLAALVDGVPRDERGSIKAALPTRKPDDPKEQDRPFAHPYFWAAFVLIGDPF